jgi:SAM-dependent methyltransferase
MDIKKLKPKQRFSDKVDVYIKYRPEYPKEIIEVLRNEYNLTTSSLIADIGSGTGKLSSLFVDNRNILYGIEPNDEMRKAAEKIFIDRTNFVSINGSAEETTLKDMSVDFIVVGQAFHWFDKEMTKIEFNRILKNNGIIVLVWNKRDNTIKIMQEYENILQKQCPEYKEIGYGLYKEEEIIKYFKPNIVKKYSFKNSQVFNFYELIGRAKSSSYFPAENSKAYALLISELKDFFEKYEENAKIPFLYNTIMYVSS